MIKKAKKLKNKKEKNGYYVVMTIRSILPFNTYRLCF